MTMLNTASSWHVGRTSGRCAACGVDLPPNTPCWAALCDGGQPPAAPPAGKKGEADGREGSPFTRVDFCESCWAAGKRPEHLPPPAAAEGAPAARPLEMFSFWKTTVPVPQQKKKLLVDDSVLMDVFQRMEGKAEPQEIRFRFVLALILMRKRLLKYDGMEATPAPAASASAGTAPPEVWRMTPRGADQPVHVVNPHLTADQISEVSQQLSAILAEEV
jgi:hypothetical protein